MIWLGNLEWCICILKRKSVFLSQVFVFYSVTNVGDFSVSKDILTGRKFKNSFKKNILHFTSNEMHFCNYLGRGFNIQGYKGNKFFDPKSLVGSYGDALLNTRFCRHFDIRMYEIKWRKCVQQKFGIKDFIILILGILVSYEENIGYIGIPLFPTGRAWRQNVSGWTQNCLIKLD